MFDVIVIGAGHAGLEASMAAANLGRRVLTLCINLDSVGFLACNPAIGGNAKSHLAIEIDALGGVMGKLADQTAIQIRMLNTGKGAAVQSLRAQVDNIKYPKVARKMLEDHPNITLMQGEVTRIEPSSLNPLFRETTPLPPLPAGYSPRLKGEFPEVTPRLSATLSTGETYLANSIVVATGVYLDSSILIGHVEKKTGPNGFANASKLSVSLKKLGLNIRRFKTGTPPRLDAQTIDYEKTKPQDGDDDIQTFSFITKKPVINKVSCHLTYTNQTTHKIIKDNLHLGAMGGGLVTGAPPRYCPSIEDKLKRFAEKERHQIFLEPESLTSTDVYMQGMNTSLPLNIQQDFVNSIVGLENAKVARAGYAIEYDNIDPLQLTHSLEYKGLPGLFFAGQVNGTSGYEEAAAQGLIAGINAAGKNFTLNRTNSYIGVLIDDIVTEGINDPYRMLTSRAEHRLHLRQDNADVRLTPLGRDVGLVCDERWKAFQKKQKQIAELLANPTSTKKFPPAVIHHVETELKYAGYIKREKGLIERALKQEETLLPKDVDYSVIRGLSLEAAQKMNLVKPLNIGQASRISGVTPADVNVLLIWLRKQG